MERGIKNCVERNGSERSEVASEAKRKPPASPGHREGQRLWESARYDTIFTRRGNETARMPADGPLSTTLGLPGAFAFAPAFFPGRG
jgi:hypothetical protein